jgi:hypothetical protein
MNNAQNIPWKRISVEAVAIVASILLAFSIDALWENYQDRREEYEILLGLNDEFSRHVASIEESIRQVEQISDSIGFLLNYGVVDIDSVDSIEIIEQAVFHASRTTPPDELSGGVRDALFASGKFDLIRNVDLREALVEWPESVNQVEQQRNAVSGFVMQSLMPHLSSMGVPLAEMRLPGGLRLTDRIMDPDELGVKYADLISDQEYRNLVTVRNWWAFGTLIDYQNAADRAREIVEITKRELESAN